jgi:YD repeat-containing protein
MSGGRSRSGALNRLTGVNYGDGYFQSYTFDPMGNRLTMTDAQQHVGFRLNSHKPSSTSQKIPEQL